MMKRGDRALYAVLSIFFLALCAPAGFFFLREGGTASAGYVIEITYAGDLVRSADLAGMTPASVIELHEGGGTNILSVTDGAVRMASSDCPGGDCMRMQPLSSKRGAIICLPHKIVVRLNGGAPADVPDAVSY